MGSTRAPISCSAVKPVTPAKFAPRISALKKIVPLKFAFANETSRRTALLKFALLKLAKFKTAPVKSMPVKSWPVKSVSIKFERPLFVPAVCARIARKAWAAADNVMVSEENLGVPFNA